MTVLGTRVRLYVERDFDDLVSCWHETNRVSYPYVEAHQKYTLDQAKAFFRNQVLVRCEVWVAFEAGTLLGLLALEAAWMRQFAVFPAFQRCGVGTALLAKAREQSPAGLSLFTFRHNKPARAFYEKHGFVAVAFGVSPGPEWEPDVEYRWQPA